MKTHATAILFCVLAWWPGAAVAAWGSATCGPVWAAPTVRTALVRQGWERSRGCWYYYCAGVQTAGYDPEQRIFRTYDGAKDVWSEPKPAPWEAKKEEKKPGASACKCKTWDGCASPCGPDCKCDDHKVGQTDAATGDPKEPNFGLDKSRMLPRGEQEEYTINGNSVTPEQATEALDGPNLVDDSHKMRVTVIGSEAACKAVLEDIDKSPVLGPLKDKALVQAYPPDHWAVAGSGFVTTGKPTVYVQSPDGKVLHRQDDYDGGAVALAAAIRKADPTYDPKADKDGRKADADSSFSLADIPIWLYGVGAGLALLIIKRKATQS